MYYRGCFLIFFEIISLFPYGVKVTMAALLRTLLDGKRIESAHWQDISDSDGLNSTSGSVNSTKCVNDPS